MANDANGGEKPSSVAKANVAQNTHKEFDINWVE